MIARRTFYIFLSVICLALLIACSRTYLPDVTPACSCRTGIALRHYAIRDGELKKIYSPYTILCAKCKGNNMHVEKEKKIHLIIELNHYDIASLQAGRPIYQDLPEADGISMGIEVSYTGDDYFGEDE